MPDPTVVVVTDSTASLPDEVVAERGIRVVPLQVVVNGRVHDDGSDDVTPARVAEALRAKRQVSTSRPPPALFARAYAEAAAAGATSCLSIHLSGEMSGTYEAAQLAAREADLPVHCLDTRQVGAATGYAVLAACDALDAGATPLEALEAARTRAAACTSLFYVDTLEYLRRGGRVGTAAALVGGALAVKPLLTITGGTVGSLERVRTSGRALARLEALAVEAAGDAAVDVCVAHLAAPERAEVLTAALAERLAEQLEGREPWCAELGAVLGAHVGPGMLAVCVAPREGLAGAS